MYQLKMKYNKIFFVTFLLVIVLVIIILLYHCIIGVELDYEILFNGFITINFDEEYLSIISEPIVFNSKEEWDSFGANYLTNHYEELYSYITLFGGINFEEESMIYYCYINPKSWYDDVKNIESIKMMHNDLIIKFASNNNHNITVLNPINIKHPYILLAKIDKNKIPSNLENYYNEAEYYY